MDPRVNTLTFADTYLNHALSGKVPAALVIDSPSPASPVYRHGILRGGGEPSVSRSSGKSFPFEDAMGSSEQRSLEESGPVVPRRFHNA